MHPPHNPNNISPIAKHVAEQIDVKIDVKEMTCAQEEPSLLAQPVNLDNMAPVKQYIAEPIDVKIDAKEMAYGQGETPALLVEPMDNKNLIHLIWFGESLVDRRDGVNFTRIINLTHLNPMYTVILWTDQKTQDAVQTFTGALLPTNFAILNFDSVFVKFEKYSKQMEIIKYMRQTNNIENETYNYACASDIARMMILSVYAGIYIDCDTEPLRTLPLMDAMGDEVRLGGDCPPDVIESNVAVEVMQSTLSNDVILIPKKNSNETLYYLHFIEKYMTREIQQTIKDSCKDMNKIVEHRQNSRKFATETFGPILTRCCILCSFDEIDEKVSKAISEYKSQTQKQSYEPIQKSLSEIFSESLSQQYKLQQYKINPMPKECLQRRQSFSWGIQDSSKPTYNEKSVPYPNLFHPNVQTIMYCVCGEGRAQSMQIGQKCDKGMKFSTMRERFQATQMLDFKTLMTQFSDDEAKKLKPVEGEPFLWEAADDMFLMQCIQAPKMTEPVVVKWLEVKHVVVTQQQKEHVTQQEESGEEKKNCC